MEDEPRHTPEGLMEVADVVKYTKMSEGFIRKRTAAGAMPVVRMGRRTLYRRADIDEWLQSLTVKPKEGAA